MEPIRFDLFFALFLAGGWFFGRVFSRLRLPSILGMVVFGVGLSLVSKPLAPPLLWELAPSLKSFALVVILLRAGLSIRKKTLSDVGMTALLMSFVPCLIEGAGLTVLFHVSFGFPWAVSGLTAFMLAAVSPAVVIPSMLDLKERKRGEKHEVPTIIMAGASIDDVFAITLFSVFLGLSVGDAASPAVALASVPLSIGFGIAAGLVVGFVFSRVFARHYASIRATEKALLLLVGATLLVDVGDSFHFAALLGVMTAGFVILERHERVAHELAGKLSKVWVFSEIVLFTLIGFSLDPAQALSAGPKALAVIAGGLVFRSIGVFAATARSSLTMKERAFCAIAYVPKATVQAALGGVALSRGVPEGETILAIAVLAILFTAPLGLLGIRFFGPRLLTDDGSGS